jgi:hypothetical protein
MHCDPRETAQCVRARPASSSKTSIDGLGRADPTQIQNITSHPSAAPEALALDDASFWRRVRRRNMSRRV